jgi:hypothetical protein
MTNKPFWSTGRTEPLRKFRWKVFIQTRDDDKTNIWFAKSVQQPAVEYSLTEEQLLNFKVTYVGIVDWKPIEVTLIDVGDQGIKYFQELTSHRAQTFAQPRRGRQLKDLRIVKYNSEGNPLEEWTFKRPYIKSADFGELSYESDDLIEIKLGIAYDSAHLGKPNKQ